MQSDAAVGDSDFLNNEAIEVIVSCQEIQALTSNISSKFRAIRAAIRLRGDQAALCPCSAFNRLQCDPAAQRLGKQAVL